MKPPYSEACNFIELVTLLTADLHIWPIQIIISKYLMSGMLAGIPKINAYLYTFDGFFAYYYDSF